MTPRRLKRAGQRPTKEKVVRWLKGAKAGFVDDLADDEAVTPSLPEVPAGWPVPASFKKPAKPKVGHHKHSHQTGHTMIAPFIRINGRTKLVSVGGSTLNQGSHQN